MLIESPKKRVLILTADVGFGHRSAANAVAAALKERYRKNCQVEIVNPLDDKRTPALLRETQTDYDKLVKKMPESYRVSYKISNEPVPNAIVEQTLTLLLFNVLSDLIKNIQPHVVVVTNSIYLAPLKSVLALHRFPIPYQTVITDLTKVHRQWFNDGADDVFVPTPDVFKQGLKFGFPTNRIHLTGIPVSIAIAQETRPRMEIREALGWDLDATTLLVVGSKRVKNLDKVLHVINHSGLAIQLVIVAGGDDDLYTRLSQVEWHSKVHLYNFVNQMPDFLHAADCILSKAGGLIVSEALACGLPFLLVDVTPGQEEGNAEYVIRNRAGELAKTPTDALEVLYHWMEGGKEKLWQYAEASRSLGRPLAAYEIAEVAWQAAERGRIDRSLMSAQAIAKLRETLDTFNRSWDIK